MQLFQNSQVLDLSVFVPLPFVLPNLLRSSLLVLFVSHINCSRLRIAKSFTQKLLRGLTRGTGACVLQSLGNTLALRRVPCIFWTYIYNYIYTHAHVSVGLASLAQLHELHGNKTSSSQAKKVQTFLTSTSEKSPNPFTAISAYRRKK